MKKQKKTSKPDVKNEKKAADQKPEMKKLAIDQLEDVTGGRMAASPPWVEC